MRGREAVKARQKFLPVIRRERIEHRIPGPEDGGRVGIKLERGREGIGGLRVFANRIMAEAQPEILPRGCRKFLGANPVHLGRRSKREVDEIFEAKVEIVLLVCGIEFHGALVALNCLHVVTGPFLHAAQRFVENGRRMRCECTV